MAQKSSDENTVLLKLNHIDYDQDTMACLIDKSISPVSVAYGDMVNTVNKENIHFVDINNCAIEVKLKSNDEYFANYSDDNIQSKEICNVSSKNITSETRNINQVIKNTGKYKKIIQSRLETNFSSGSGSGSGSAYLSYGVDII